MNQIARIDKWLTIRCVDAVDVDRDGDRDVMVVTAKRGLGRSGVPEPRLAGNEAVCHVSRPYDRLGRVTAWINSRP